MFIHALKVYIIGQKTVHVAIYDVKYVFGTFGLSTKEPYTIMLCLSCVVISIIVGIVWVHLLARGLNTETFIFDTQMHIKYLVILTCSFKWQPFWYFSLFCYPAHVDSHTNFISHVHMYLFCTFIHKRDNATVTDLLKFMSILKK